MEHIRRTERLAVISQILLTNPNRLYNLNEFGQMLNAAKSSISEDIELLAEACEKYGVGAVETIPGAAGGVRYRPRVSKEKAAQIVSSVAKKLSEPGRLLPGSFLYSSDVASDPEVTRQLASVVAAKYMGNVPDFVLTMETKGIPFALMTAQALGAGLVIARRDSKAYEGSAVKINYISGSDNERVDTMAISRRAVKAGQKALIVDDFAKGGGTLQGMTEMMHECQIEVLGVEVMIATRQPKVKLCKDVSSLMWLNGIDRLTASCDVVPDDRYLMDAASEGKVEP